MSIRRKTLLILTITLTVVMLVAFIISQIILLGSFSDLEKQDTEKNIQRALNALDTKLTTMLSTNKDWAHWDDTYSFVQNGNQKYQHANIIDATFVTNNLNFMLFINADGETVFSRGFDLQKQQRISAPESFSQYLHADSPLFRHTDSQIDLNGFKGILILPEGPVMVVSSAILTSNQDGPPQGSLIWGRYLDEVEIQNLAETTALSLNIYSFEDSRVQQVKQELINQSDPVIQPVDNKTITGYVLISDILNRPALILKIEQPRDIYARGRNSVTYFLVTLFLTGIIFTVAGLVQLDRLILSRLSRLSSTVIRIQTSGDLSISVHCTGEDEVSMLAEAIQGMLKSLREAHDELEQRVKERTAELSRVNAMLVQARDQALEALRLKTQILANVSHDARTPLNVIALRTDTLLRGRYGSITPEQNKALESIQLNTNNLLGFFNNLLVEAQLGSNQAKLVCVRFEPGKLVEEVRLSLHPLAEKKGLALRTELSNAPAMFSDPERLKQILANLVDNAIKFTERGTITLRVCPQDAGHIVFQVSDTGAGIPSEMQPRIFEAFWQADGSITRTTNRGVGLGLSIVRQLTTLLGGTISVQSEVGKGTTFTIVLPLETGELIHDAAISVNY